MHKDPTRSWSRLSAATAIVVAAITGVSACSSNTPPNSTPPSSQTSSASETTSQHLTASDFSSALKQPGTIVLDVRTPSEFASGHLPQARNVDIEGSGFATRIAALNKDQTYAVYCHSGNRSGVALEQTAAIGFTHVYDLAGGIGAWQSMGGPVVSGS